MDVHLSTAGAPLNILLLSTGDVCRGPAALALLADALRVLPGGPVPLRLTSAGTQAPIGCDLHPLTLQALREHGVEPAEHFASELTAARVAAADLILGAERQHRLAAVELDVSAANRSFTLRELARALRTLGPLQLPGPAPALDRVAPTADRLAPDRLALDRAELPELLLAHRDRWRPLHPADDDIGDPVTGGVVVHESAVRQLREAVAACAEPLAAWARDAVARRSVPAPSGAR